MLRRIILIDVRYVNMMNVFHLKQRINTINIHLTYITAFQILILQN